MSQVESLFKFPREEISRIERDIATQFGHVMAGFITKEARFAASSYHDECAHLLVNRFSKMNQVVKKLPSEPTKQQYDQFVQDILSLAEPSEIFKEMEMVVLHSDVNHYYQEFIMRSDRDMFHQLYLDYAFPKDAVKQLNQLAMVQINDSIHQLHQYISSLHEHNQLIRQIQEKRKGNTVLKTGASLLGLGIGIPFLGAGLGMLLGEGDKDKIQQSLGNVFDHIDFMEESIYDTVDKLGDSLYLLFLTLFSGTFISVSRALQSQHICIAGMDEGNVITYSLTTDEKYEFEKWFQVSLTGITELVHQKRWHDAIRLVKEMHQIIAAKPIHSLHEVAPNKSALYITHVYYYAVYQEALLEEYRAGHVESFVKQSKAFWDTLILFPLEKDMPAFASHPAYFIFLYLKQYIHGHPRELYWLNKADEYIGERRLHNVLKGELGDNPEDYMRNVKTFFVGIEFYNHFYKRKDRAARNTNEQMYGKLSEEEIERFIEIDRNLQHPDKLTDFLQTIKNRKAKARRAPYIRRTLQAVAIAITIIIVFSLAKPVLPKVATGITNTTSFISEKWTSLTASITGIWQTTFAEDEEPKVVEEIRHVQITEATVNIRETPSLNGKVIATGYADEMYSYLNFERIDEDGITWLAIELTDGRTAYVSKKVAVIH